MIYRAQHRRREWRGKSPSGPRGNTAEARGTQPKSLIFFATNGIFEANLQGRDAIEPFNN